MKSIELRHILPGNDEIIERITNIDHIVYISPREEEENTCLVKLSTGEHIIEDSHFRELIDRINKLSQ